MNAMHLGLMTLGVIPVPTHQPAPEKPAKVGNTKSRREKAAERRAKVLEILRDEPATISELMIETGAPYGVTVEDLTVLQKEQGVRFRLHKGENLYWVAA